MAIVDDATGALLNVVFALEEDASELLDLLKTDCAGEGHSAGSVHGSSWDLTA
jgi:hypothetical protein